MTSTNVSSADSVTWDRRIAIDVNHADFADVWKAGWQSMVCLIMPPSWKKKGHVDLQVCAVRFGNKCM